MPKDIYSGWYPRYYYILKNKTSNKQYLGQTTAIPGKNYLGSGLYWVKHCKSNGGYNTSNIECIWMCWFDKESEAINFILEFESTFGEYYNKDNNEWANLIPENTKNNPFYGAGEYQKERIANGEHPFNNKETYKKRWTKEHRENQSRKTANNNRKWWEEASELEIIELKRKISEGNKGKSSPRKGISRTEDEIESISKGTKTAMGNTELREYLSKKAKDRCGDAHIARTKETNKRRVCCIKCRFETGLSSLPSHQHGSKCR